MIEKRLFVQEVGHAVTHGEYMVWTRLSITHTFADGLAVRYSVGDFK
jgi:hypothetical protein